MNEPTTTVVGNLTSDPELRYTPNGAAVASFTVAATPRTFDRQTSEWKEGETLFMRCTLWREPAENLTQSLTRGARVIVTGRLVSRSFDTKAGEKRTVMELQVDEVGPSLRYATTQVTRTKNSGGGSGQWQQQSPPAGGQSAWGSQQSQAGQQSGDDEPPF